MFAYYSYIARGYLSKKACFMQRDILHMNMNTHIIIHT